MTHPPQPRPSRGRQPLAVFIVFALVAVTLLAALGCGADAGTRPSIDGPSGQYALASIDRVSLPARVFRGSGNDPLTGRFYNQLTIVVNAAEINFFSAERFAIQFDLTVTKDGTTRNTPFYVTGTYEQDDDDIYFVGDDGIEGEFFGALDNDAVIMLLDISSTGNGNQYNFSR
jgi:hypothetical protein